VHRIFKFFGVSRCAVGRDVSGGSKDRSLQGVRDALELLDSNFGGAVIFRTYGTAGPTRCGIPEDLNLQQHCCEELRS
jgi:hypothetical protein